MKPLFIALLLCVGITSAKAQMLEKKSFMVMNGYGYCHNEFADGFGTVTTFLRSVNRWWGYGADLGITTGKGTEGPWGSNHEMRDTRMTRYFIGPSVYFTPLNIKRHLFYIGATVGYAHNNQINLLTEKQDNVFAKRWLTDKGNAFGFGANAGYSFKLAEHWSIGARAYFHHANEYSISGLLNLGIHF